MDAEPNAEPDSPQPSNPGPPGDPEAVFCWNLYFFGAVFAVVGLGVRVWARRLAWPRGWSYSGDRANTMWAYDEALYIDLGLVALVFGLGIILVAFFRENRA